MKYLFAICATFILLFTSCETCMTCTYTQYQSGEEITEEVCGNKKEIESFASTVEDSALVNRSTYDCIENH